MPKSFDIYAQVDKDYEGAVAVYAELTRKQLGMIQQGVVEMEIPFGTSMKNKQGSRGLHFICDSVAVAKELEDGLDASGVSWQEEFLSENI